MAFGDYVRLLRTYWKSILLVTLIGIGASVGLTLSLTPKYTATSQVLFTPTSVSTSGQDLAFAAQYTQSRMVAYQSLVKTPQVLGLVVSALNLDETPTKLADRVSAEFPPTSTLLTINVEDTSAERSARISRAVSQSLINAVSQFESQADPTAKGNDKTIERVTGKLVTDPAVPTSPSSPNLQLNLAAGALLGLILGIAQAGVRFVRAGYAGPEPRSASSQPPVAPSSVPAAPVPPRAAKPKPQKRPGKRTRR